MRQLNTPTDMALTPSAKVILSHLAVEIALP